MSGKGSLLIWMRSAGLLRLALFGRAMMMTGWVFLWRRGVARVVGGTSISSGACENDRKRPCELCDFTSRYLTVKFRREIIHFDGA